MGLISEKLRPDKCDIVIGILWASLGTPSPVLMEQTPTEFEIRSSIKALARQGRPEVCVWFREEPLYPKDAVAVEQLARVMDFRRWVRQFCLTGSYKTTEGFRWEIYNALRQSALQLIETEKEFQRGPSQWSFTAAGEATLLRRHGTTERVGDVYLTVLGHAAEPVRQICSIRLFTSPSINMTNRMNAEGMTDAILFDESSSTLPIGIFGRIVACNSVVFDRVEIRIGEAIQPQVLRISNVRVNASQWGTPGGVVRLAMEVKEEGSGKIVHARILAPAVGILSGDECSLSVTSSNEEPGALEIHAAEGINGDAFGGQPEGYPLTLRLDFEEKELGMFRDRNEELSLGSPVALPHEFIPTEQPSSSGTRFLVGFNNIPDQVRLFVTVTNIHKDGTPPQEPSCRLVSTYPNGASLTSEFVHPSALSNQGVGVVEMPIIGGCGLAVWEWIVPAEQPLGLRSMFIGVLLIARGGEASPGTATVYGLLGPTSTNAAASSVSHIPRFVDDAPARSAFSFV